MGGSPKSAHDHDLEALDASWDDEEEEPESEDEPGPDLDSLDAGWDDPKRYKTAAEKEAARKAKARARSERQRERASLVSQKQKKKQPKKRTSQVPDAPRSRAASPRPPKTADKRDVAVAAVGLAPKRDWTRMLVAVAIIIALAAFTLFVVLR